MMTRPVRALFLALLVTLLCMAGWLLWLLLMEPSLDPATDSLSVDTSFVLPAGPELADANIIDPPLYLYLFTHTEDHINHTLSEERYWHVGAFLEKIRQEHPSLPLTWTIEFQGADAATVADRNAETGLLDYLLNLHEQDLVEFGYHAHHDPTYNNRPQKDLSDDPTFSEVYDAMTQWLLCEKDPLFGDCLSPDGGGLQTILQHFGQVEVVTGVGYSDGFLIERSAGSQVIREQLPDRLLGFGLPDHGSALNDRGYDEARLGLLTLLTPTNETSSGTYWMDNAIRINDGAPLSQLESLQVKDGALNLKSQLSTSRLDRSHVLNVHIADKYIYTKAGTSPTKWAYANPTDPELPDEWLNSERIREGYYESTHSGLAFLTDLMADSDNGSQFVSSDEVVNLFTSDDYWQVDQDELEQLALWLLHEWHEAPPNWVYDGEDFYSLTDAWMLLQSGLNNLYPEHGPISSTYAPWSGLEQVTPATVVTYEDVMTFAQDVSVIEDRLDVAYEIGDTHVSLTQSLYAMAYAYVMHVQGVEGRIEIPAVSAFSESYSFLETLGCHGCFDTTWSLKPARFQD